MTVNSLNITDGPYVGNGVASTFDYSFVVQNKNEIRVYETNVNGVQTLLTVDTDYTVGNIGTDNGVVIRTAGPLPTGWKWYIRSNYQPIQTTSFNSQGAFFPDLHEFAMDKLTYLIQQITDITNRSLHYPESLDLTGIDLTVTPAPNTVMQWNSDGTAVENKEFGDLYRSDPINAEVINTDIFTGTGVTTVFNLTDTPTTIYSMTVVIDGVDQLPNIDYQVSGKNLTFTVAPPKATTIAVSHARTAGYIAVPAHNSSLIDAADYFNGSTVEDALQEVGRNLLEILEVSPEYFGCVGDGVTDDTANFQAAINYCSSSSRVRTIKLGGNKKYRILGTLNISAPVQTLGQGVYDLENTRGITIPNGGSWFIHANPTGPLFKFNNNLSKGARIKDFGIFQEGHSAPGPGWTPAVRDWVIRNENTQGTLHIDGVHFHNVYRGVLTDFAVRPRYKNITGQFFLRGFSFDRIYDIGTFDGLHEWTYWSEADSVIQYQQANCVGITFLRTDGMWLANIFTFGIATGIYFGLSAYGGTGRVIEIADLYCDFTGRAIVIDASVAHCQVGSMFHLGQAWPAAPFAALPGACAIGVASGSNTLVQVGHLYSVVSESAAVKVEGTANQVWISSEIIEQYDVSGSGSGAHYISDASSSVKLASEPSLSKYGGGYARAITAASAGTIFAQTVQKLYGNNTVNKPLTAGGATGQAGVVTVEGEANASIAVIAQGTGFVNLGSATNSVGMYGGPVAPKGAITGSKGGNAAVASMAAYGAARGWWTDSTT